MTTKEELKEIAEKFAAEILDEKLRAAESTTDEIEARQRSIITYQGYYGGLLHGYECGISLYNGEKPDGGFRNIESVTSYEPFLTAFWLLYYVKGITKGITLYIEDISNTNKHWKIQ